MRTFLHHWFGIPTRPGKGPFLKAPIEIAADQSLKLSFCITHKNRFEHLQKTLFQNLKDNEEDRIDIEFILMDFDESDVVEKLTFSSVDPRQLLTSIYFAG